MPALFSLTTDRKTIVIGIIPGGLGIAKFKSQRVTEDVILITDEVGSL
jgi:hypothetical protein|tara:strand:+ start:718 stop:861 length:144 start_codon:yes stop_codon:yes gene_type:complete